MCAPRALPGPRDASTGTRNHENLKRRYYNTALRVIVLGLGVYLLLPRIAGLRDALDSLVRLQWWLVPLLVGLEAASLALYAELARAVFGMEGVAPTRRLLGLAVLAGTALGKVLPGGTVAALPPTVGILRREHLDPALSATALLASGVLSSLVLVVALPVVSALSVLAGGGGAAALGLGGVVLAIGVLAGLGWLGVRDPDLGHYLSAQLNGLVRGRRLRAWLHVEDAASGLERAAVALQAVASNGRGMARAAGLALASWACDLGVIAALAVAVTRGAPLAGVALAYVVGQLAAALPLTPGGIGVVETAMIGALATQGMPAGEAAAVVLTWRLVSHWLPMLVGLVVYASVRVSNAAQP
ncbi:MAG TPA: lysylphosphatidylglycerol synthase transmembrane domain-containing protein [Acidimicrobiales bacterium]|nr:lysylphosphatidylglycerol synthase transmembrane domain-containing protein [Acidimicrobiales bacterium]